MILGACRPQKFDRGPQMASCRSYGINVACRVRSPSPLALPDTCCCDGRLLLRQSLISPHRNIGLSAEFARHNVGVREVADHVWLIRLVLEMRMVQKHGSINEPMVTKYWRQGWITYSATSPQLEYRKRHRALRARRLRAKTGAEARPGAHSYPQLLWS